MTFLEGKNKVLKLLDEYGAGVGGEEELELRMADFFDIAQKRLAQIRRIPALRELERREGVTEYDMPEDFLALRCIYRGSRPWKGFEWRAGKLVVPESERERIVIEYCRLPATVTEETPDDYVFEIAEDAAQCMVFFVAGQCLISDLLQDGSAFMDIYERMVRELGGETAANRSAVRNTLFRG